MARRFDDVSDDSYLRNASAVVPFTYPISVSVWFYADDTDADTYTLFSLGDSGSDNRLSIELDNSTRKPRAVHDDGTRSFAQTSALYTRNAWNNVVGLWRSNSHRQITLNGTSVASNFVTRTTFSIDQTAIGAHWGATASDFFTGRIAEVTVWDIEHSSTSIAAGIGRGISGTFFAIGDIKAHWHLYGDASPEPDKYGNFDMTLINSPTAEASPLLASPFSPYTALKTQSLIGLTSPLPPYRPFR